MVLAHNHIYPHTKFKSSRYNTFEVIGIKYDFSAKKGHPVDVERLATSHKTIGFQPLPISIHIPSLKALGQIFFESSRTKGNPCGGSGVTLLKPKYPRLSSGDTINDHYNGCIYMN